MSTLQFLVLQTKPHEPKSIDPGSETWCHGSFFFFAVLNVPRVTQEQQFHLLGKWFSIELLLLSHLGIAESVTQSLRLRTATVPLRTAPFIKKILQLASVSLVKN